MLSAAKTAAVCASLSTISLGSYSPSPRAVEDLQSASMSNQPAISQPAISKPVINHPVMSEFSEFSPLLSPPKQSGALTFVAPNDTLSGDLSAPYSRPLSIPHNWGLEPQGVMTAAVLIAAILVIARLKSERKNLITNSGSSSSGGRTGWGTTLAQGLSEVVKRLTPAHELEMPPINTPQFIKCALEVERFNHLNREISGVNSDLSAVNRHGMADQNHDLSYYEAIKKGWELFLEERGFALVETLWEKSEGEAGRTVMHARLDFAIQDPARAALALQLLIPESYVKRVAPDLALLIRRLEDSCIRFALTEVCSSHSIWDFKQLSRELDSLRLGLLGLRRRSVADELQFFSSLINHDRVLFKDLCNFDAVIRNEEVEGRGFWVAPSNLESAVKIAESTYKRIRPQHQLERLTMERMTSSIRDTLDLCKVEQERHFLNDESASDGGTAVANEPPKRVELYSPRMLADFESRLRTITLTPLNTHKNNSAGDAKNHLNS